MKPVELPSPEEIINIHEIRDFVSEFVDAALADRAGEAR